MKRKDRHFYYINRISFEQVHIFVIAKNEAIQKKRELDCFVPRNDGGESTNRTLAGSTFFLQPALYDF